MNIDTNSLGKDSNIDIDLIFIDEVRIKETEQRFAPYLEYSNFNEDNQSISEEDWDNSDASDIYWQINGII